MALRILTTRLMTANMPQRVCVTSNASMSSSSSSSGPSSSPSSTSSTPATKESAEVGSTAPKKKESLFQHLTFMLRSTAEAANPNDPPIPTDKIKFPDAVEQATGEYKLLLLAFENGVLDPYNLLPVQRKGRGTKDNPVPIESFVDERLVACSCEKSQSYFKYMTVYKGEPKRCQCGHWMELVDAPRFWEKIPREDLVEIPFFREMEEEGKLDKLLSGELDRELAEKARHEDHHH